MSTSVTFNGTSYTVPAIADASWGTNVSNYLIAIASGCLQKTGGAFTLSQADVDFGATYGLKAVYFKSKTANIASAGVVQLARTDVISWRNQANGADLSLSVDSSNNLSFNGALLVNLALGGAYAVLQMNAGATAYSWATPTGTGAPALQTSPSFTTPTLGVATATSINKMAITAPATSSTLAVADGKTATFSNTLTFAGTDGKTMTFSNSLTFTGTDGNSFAFPSGSSTVMTLASADTITGIKSFNDGKLALNGSSSGSMTVKAPAAASTFVATFFAATDTVMGLTFQQIATNKILSDSTIKFGNVSDTTKALLFSLGGATTAKTMTLISSHTNDRSITFPDATDTLVGKATTDALTNKDFQGGTASNSNRITVPNAATATLSALTRKQGTIVYDTTLNQLFSDDGSNLNPVGSGAGEKNYIATGSSNAGGWTASGGGVTVATDTTAADLPRSITSKSGILISRVSGSTAYAYYRFTLDPADYNTLLKIQLAMKPGGSYVASDFKVDMYSNTASDYSGTSTRLALTTDSSAVTALPNFTGTYRTAFGATSSTAPYMELRVGLNASTSGTTLAISDVIVGPGIVIQGAAISPWTSFTMTLAGSGTTPVKGTIVTDEALWRRVGDSMEIQYRFKQSGTGTTGTGDMLFTIPNSLTIDTSKITVSAVGFKVVGFGHSSTASANATGSTSLNLAMLAYDSTHLAAMQDNHDGTFTILGNSNSYLGGNANASLSFSVTIPIAEWAGAGTINVVQNDVEYAANSSLTDADDTSSFVYGPTGNGGSLTTLTALRKKRIRFKTPVQATDQVVIEIKVDNVWVPVTAEVRNSGGSTIAQQFKSENGVTYGIGFYSVASSTTDVDIMFGQYRGPASTYGGAGGAWSSLSFGSDWGGWRAKKFAGGQAVGFANVAQNTAGLVKSAGQLLGTNTNDSANAGNVSEYTISSRLRSAATSSTSNSVQNVLSAALSLTAGEWEIGGAIGVIPAGSTSVTTLIASISLTSATQAADDTRCVPTGGESKIAWNQAAAVPASDIDLILPPTRATISATTSYYLVLTPTFTVSTMTCYGSLWARRVR